MTALAKTKVTFSILSLDESRYCVDICSLASKPKDFTKGCFVFYIPNIFGVLTLSSDARQMSHLIFSRHHNRGA